MSNHNIAAGVTESLRSDSRLQEVSEPRHGHPATGSAEEQHKISILIGDREAIFRLGMRRLLMSEDDLSVVSEIDQPLELLSQVVDFRPDVVFVQHEMLRPDAPAALAALREGAPASRLVVMASAVSEDEAVAFMKAGARGVILKTADPALFVKCARKVAEGEIWLPKRQVAQMARVLSEPQNRPVDTLTNREKLVISCLVQGWRNREIAGHLSITEQTVKNHLRSVFDKVGVSDRVELVLYAIHQRLDLPPVAAGPQPL
jgi:DNA-binding NarL/FixJ family response regulator